MKIRILLAVLVPLALLLAAGVYSRRYRHAEALYQHHWRQEQEHLLALDGGIGAIMLGSRGIRVQSGYGIGLPAGVDTTRSLFRSDLARDYHEKQATHHRHLKEHYKRIMHRPWTSGD